MVCVHTTIVITYAINMKNYLSCVSFNESFTNISDYFLETAVVWSSKQYGLISLVIMLGT